MKSFQLLGAALLASSLLVGDANADGRKAGSVLFFPVHRSAEAFTIICVTNTNLIPANRQSLGGSTNVHYQYVNVVPNRDNAFRPLNCIVFDRVEFLTPADTLCVLTACHNAGYQEGFVLVNAEDPNEFRKPWSHNFLMGSEYVINGSGVVYSLEAVPFSSPVAWQAKTDLNNNRRLDFDGAEYEQIPDILYIDSFIALEDSGLTLTNFTGMHQDINTIYLSVWNDNEFPLSATVEFNCWFDEELTKVSPLFRNSFLQSTPNDPRELDVNCNNTGDVETGWASIDSIDVRNPGGASISMDGAVLGAITVGQTRLIDGGRLLWESLESQANGSFIY
jgi:hypothetical protein